MRSKCFGKGIDEWKGSCEKLDWKYCLGIDFGGLWMLDYGFCSLLGRK